MERGDVVIFRNPENRHQNYIKRIIALPGDTVELKGGQLVINDRVLPTNEMNETSDLNRLPDPSSSGSSNDSVKPFWETNGDRRYSIWVDDRNITVDMPKQTVPNNSYFVMGDNRNASRDSRELGFIPHGDLVGVVEWLYWPGNSWNRFGRVRNAIE